jgi:hypothetical protein
LPPKSAVTPLQNSELTHARRDVAFWRKGDNNLEPGYALSIAQLGLVGLARHACRGSADVGAGLGRARFGRRLGVAALAVGPTVYSTSRLTDVPNPRLRRTPNDPQRQLQFPSLGIGRPH